MLFLACWFYGTPTLGQHFTECLQRTSNATVLIPGDVAAELGGATLAPGDEIALFTPDGACAGAGEWNGAHLAIPAAGTNSQETGGYESGEPLQFKVWDASAALTFSVNVTYASCAPGATLCRDDGRYRTDAFYIVEGMTAHSTAETADLQLEITTDTLRATPGQSATFALILSNEGPHDARDLAVTISPAADLAIPSATPSHGHFDTSTLTWTLDDLAADAADTLTVTISPDRADTYTLTAEVSASLLSDPDSTPNNDADDEDDRSTLVLIVEAPAECAVSTRIHDETTRVPGEPGAVTLTVSNPDGLVGLHFVDADGRTALENFTADTAHPDFASGDGVRWNYDGPTDDAPTAVTFTLIQADRSRPEARYTAEAWSVCAASDPQITRFDPSPVFTFDQGPLEVTLGGNAPNPFRYRTTIRFGLSTTARVHLSMYDVLGRKVATLVDDVLPGGPHAIRWEGRTDAGRAVTSGVYLYRLEVNDHVLTGQLNVVR